MFQGFRPCGMCGKNSVNGFGAVSIIDICCSHIRALMNIYSDEMRRRSSEYIRIYQWWNVTHVVLIACHITCYISIFIVHAWSTQMTPGLDSTILRQWSSRNSSVDVLSDAIMIIIILCRKWLSASLPLKHWLNKCSHFAIAINMKNTPTQI